MMVAEWVHDPKCIDGWIAETAKGRVLVVKLDPKVYQNHFLCSNATTSTAWQCSSDQLGVWFEGSAAIQTFRIEPSYWKAVRAPLVN